VIVLHSIEYKALLVCVGFAIVAGVVVIEVATVRVITVVVNSSLQVVPLALNTVDCAFNRTKIFISFLLADTACIVICMGCTKRALEIIHSFLALSRNEMNDSHLVQNIQLL